ncbi:unnamed protein product [Schistocephalus solidus]|uniref:C2H2-type domain-containing protein n=1 Tax=Schistocephalus solidus TaxID=70667 RepID=A0A183T1W4_SCHSO|nr:unnamed protein product [Schistocephalus solidus]
MDSLLEPSQEAESLSSQLPPQNTEAEMARQDPGHGSPGADRNPQHPCHAEASATAMERPPGVVTRPGAAPAAPATSPIFGLLDCVMTSGCGGVRRVRHGPCTTLPWSIRWTSSDYEARSVACLLSAWSVICESIAQRLVNQCLEHQHTAEIAASTALTVPAHSLIAWAYSVTCASRTAELTAMPTAPIPHEHPPLLPFLPSLPPPLPRMTPPASPDFSCPHCARNFNSRMGQVGHLRIHRTEAGEPVPGAPTYSRRTRTFTHLMGLLGHMRLHDKLR